MAMRVGIVTIATGNYINYMPVFCRTVNELFLPDNPRGIHVITDRRFRGKNVGRLPAVARPWPMGTLLRFEMMLEHRSVLSSYDALFYVDADMKVVSRVDEEIFGKSPKWMTGVIHPAFTLSGQTFFEQNEDSKAFIRPEKRGTYYQGCFFGGDRDSFFEMAEILRARIAQDLSKGIISKWWDEGHINWFFSQHPPHTVSSAYAFPEGWQLALDPKIVHLKKNDAKMRALPRRWGYRRMLSTVSGLVRRG